MLPGRHYITPQARADSSDFHLLGQCSAMIVFRTSICHCLPKRTRKSAVFSAGSPCSYIVRGCGKKETVSVPIFFPRRPHRSMLYLHTSSLAPDGGSLTSIRETRVVKPPVQDRWVPPSKLWVGLVGTVWPRGSRTVDLAAGGQAYIGLDICKIVPMYYNSRISWTWEWDEGKREILHSTMTHTTLFRQTKHNRTTKFLELSGGVVSELSKLTLTISSFILSSNWENATHFKYII